MKHLLKLADLASEEIFEILSLADQLKYERKHDIKHHILSGKTLGMIFAKSSTRTRVSFETGMYQLGGNALFLSSSDLQIGRGEPVKDTARVLSGYLDGLMIRTFAQKEVDDFAKYGSIPVINGLTDYAHPCQVLADLMTIREYKKKFDGLKLAFIGDGNNMANSLTVGALKVGMKVTLACPARYAPDSKILEFAAIYREKYGDNRFELTTSPFIAAENADVIYTDVWASMGQEQEAIPRKKAFEEFQVNSKLMKEAKPGAIVLHCLPAHHTLGSEEEITDEVFEKHAAEIFEQAENRLHAQKAVMVKLMR